MHGIVRRAEVLFKLGACIGPVVPARRLALMLVGKTDDSHVTDLQLSTQALQGHRGMHAMNRIVVEVRVSRQHEIGRDFRKLLGEPQSPGAGRIVSPWIDDDHRTSRRSDAKCHVTEELDLDLRVACRHDAAVSLCLDHIVVVLLELPGTRLGVCRCGDHAGHSEQGSGDEVTHGDSEVGVRRARFARRQPH